jgi:PPOX class probable F420-dependent enzyme
MASLTLADVRPLLDGPSPAVLTTVRKDGSPLTSPVWFDWTGEAFQIVIARDDVKLRHLAREPRCTLVIFEAVPPFRGVSVTAQAQVERTDITEHRRRVARRYLGEGRGDRFVEQRAGKPGDLVTLVPVEPRVWDLTAILPPATLAG